MILEKLRCEISWIISYDGFNFHESALVTLDPAPPTSFIPDGACSLNEGYAYCT